MGRPLTARLSLRAYLILLVVVCVLPMVLFAFWLTATIAHDRRAALLEGMLDRAHTLALAIDGDLQDDTRTLQAMAASHALDGPDLGAALVEMRRVGALQPRWGAVSLHAVDGRPLLTTGPVPATGEEEPPAGIRRVFDTGRPVVEGPIGGGQALVVTVPVLRDTVVRYALSSRVSMSAIGDVFARQALPAGWLVSLVDRHGMVIVRRGPPAVASASGSDPFPAALTGSSGGWGGYVRLPEGPFYFSYASPQLAEWRVVLAAPAAVLDRPWWQSLGMILIGGAGVLALGILLALLAVRPIARSLAALAGAAADLGRGRTPAPVGGAVAELEAVGRDLEAAGQARERVERAVREGEAQLAAIVNQATAGIAQTDVDGRLVLVNRRYCDLVGRSPDELIGRRFEDVLHPDDRGSAAAALRGLTPAEPEQAAPMRYLRPDGSLRWADVSLSLVHDAGPERSVAIVALDASGRHQAEEAVRTSDSRFHLMADAAPVLVWMAGPDGRRTWFNSQWLAFVGRGLEQEAGVGWLQNVHPEDRARGVATATPEVGARHRFGLEYRLRRHDGLYRWVRDDGVPLFDPDGRFAGYIGACVDVTSQKLAELERGELLAREQKARQDAEAASQAKDEFLAVVSHELRTPLNTIRLWAGILRGGAPDAETVQRAIETIDRNTALQARLIDDLLDASRIVSGRLRLATERVDLALVVDEAIEAVRAAAANKDITLTSTLDPDSGPVIGDPTRLQQVVWNLLTNAVRFTPAGGRVTISLRRIDREVELSVSDTGRGIAPDLLPYVFDRFRQGESGASRSHGGLGLGLSIARQLVELHGGSIRVASPGEGRGATFTVRLPGTGPFLERPGTARAISSPRGGRRAPSPALQDVHVLVVDDDAETREVMAVALAHEGARVTTVPSVADAVEAIQHGWPDVLVSDIGMPGEDGYDLIRKVRRLEASVGRHLPAIALTAYAGAEDRRRTIEAGYEAHVAKPVQASAVAPLIASLLPSRPQPTGDPP